MLGNNPFAYCGNNPVSRVDSTGCLWETLAIIGIASLASVAASAIVSWITGEEFTVGTAVGAAIEGGSAAAMIIVGVTPYIANPLATFCGEVIGNYIDGDTSADAAKDIFKETATSAGATVAFGLGGLALSKYAKVYTSGKYVKLNFVDEFVQSAVYQPKYLDESNTKTIIYDNMLDSAKSIFVDLITCKEYIDVCKNG